MAGALGSLALGDSLTRGVWNCTDPLHRDFSPTAGIRGILRPEILAPRR